MKMERSDKRIARRCRRHLSSYRTINVPNFIKEHLPDIKSNLNEVEFKSLCTRIRQRLLEYNQFTTVDGIDDFGLPKIGYKQKENIFFTFLKSAIIYAVVPLLVGYILWLIDSRSKNQQDSLQEQRLNAQSDSLWRLQHTVDSLLRK